MPAIGRKRRCLVGPVAKGLDMEQRKEATRFVEVGNDGRVKVPYNSRHLHGFQDRTNSDIDVVSRHVFRLWETIEHKFSYFLPLRTSFTSPKVANIERALACQNVRNTREDPCQQEQSGKTI